MLFNPYVYGLTTLISLNSEFWVPSTKLPCVSLIRRPVKNPAFPVSFVPIKNPFPLSTLPCGLSFALTNDDDLESPPELVFVVSRLFKVF